MIALLIIISLSVFSIISVYNLLSVPELKENIPASEYKKLVSILIPARNEEKNIEKCIQGVLDQDYKNKEIIILDDNSTDNTFARAVSFSSQEIKIIKGRELPSEWLGKNWACHQLAQNASGDYLIFIDADVELTPEAISNAVYELEESKASLLSIFPTQIIKSFGEHLVVPLMNWLLLTFLPLRFVYNSSIKSFVAANGQFMLWKRDVYFNLGGHEQVKNKIVEDIELAKLVKQNNFKVKTLLGGNFVYCRMYESFNQAYNGFTKNFYAGFSLPPVTFIIIILFLFFVFTSPFLFLISHVQLLIAIALIIISRVSVSIVSKQNLFVNVLLHPVQMLLMICIGIISVIKFKTSRLVWKQRKL